MFIAKALAGRLVILGVLACLPLPAFAQAPENRVREIASALQNHEFSMALEMLDTALQKSPNDSQLWAMRGAAYAGEHKNKQALGSFHKALQISPEYLPALQGAAQIEYDAGSPAAIALVEHVLRLRPDDRTGHAMLAVLEYRRGNCTSAVIHFEKAGNLLDSQLPALHAHGICLVKLKQPGRAVTVFQRVLVLKPESAQERRLLASVQLMAHQPKDALTTLQPLLNTGDSATLDLAAAAYEDEDDTAQAVETLRRAILADPQNVNLYLDFAHLCYAHNSYGVGVNAISDGIALRPNAGPLYLARGALYVQLGQYDKAEADFDKAHELDPRESLSSAALAVAAAQENDFHRALSTVQDKLKKKPADPLLLYLQADFLLQEGASPGSPQFQLAMKSATRAVVLQPNLTAARGVLAKLYLQSGQYQETVAQCRRILTEDPTNQTAVYHLIQALRKIGSTSEIPELLKRLATLRQQAGREEAQRNRYKLVEDDALPTGPF